jgi:hypothetical protein
MMAVGMRIIFFKTPRRVSSYGIGSTSFGGLRNKSNFNAISSFIVI